MLYLYQNKLLIGKREEKEEEGGGGGKESIFTLKKTSSLIYNS